MVEDGQNNLNLTLIIYFTYQYKFWDKQFIYIFLITNKQWEDQIVFTKNVYIKSCIYILYSSLYIIIISLYFNRN